MVDIGALDALRPELGVVCRLLDCLPSLPLLLLFPPSGGMLVWLSPGREITQGDNGSR